MKKSKEVEAVVKVLVDIDPRVTILAEFEASFKYWVGRLNLNSWDWRCRLQGEEDCGNASINIDSETGKCLVTMNPNYEACFTTPAECAKHEALELLLGDVGAYMKAFFSNNVVNTEIHKVINRLMVVLKEE
jgi:hypothetical protein